jgi:hypothetical protein
MAPFTDMMDDFTIAIQFLVKIFSQILTFQDSLFVSKLFKNFLFK